MKWNKPWITVIAGLVLLGFQPAAAQDEEDSLRAGEQAELQAAYEDAMKAAESERESAMAAVERAQAEMQRAAEAAEYDSAEVERAREAYAEARDRTHSEHGVEISEMREELSRAHEELRRASREVARVHRELNRTQGALAPASLVNLGDRAVIGVVLGESDKAGVRVLGVSPDGPAERGGIKQGDVIVSVMGEKLVTGDGPPARVVLQEAMESVKAGDELLLAVARGGEQLEFTVVAEKREPFGWQSMIRLPSTPSVPGGPVIIERIEIPEIDSEALAEQMERLREDIDRARVVIETRHSGDTGAAPETWEYEFQNLSEIGEKAMLGANVWFGMPMTEGLKLAEVDEGLGEYFKTERGVLVLKARQDNHLKLQSGDVILAVGSTEVNRPADLMRALRDLEPGSDLKLSIKRDRKDRTIDVVVPERRSGFGFVPEFEYQYHYDSHTGED